MPTNKWRWSAAWCRNVAERDDRLNDIYYDNKQAKQHDCLIYVRTGAFGRQTVMSWRWWRTGNAITDSKIVRFLIKIGEPEPGREILN